MNVLINFLVHLIQSLYTGLISDILLDGQSHCEFNVLHISYVYLVVNAAYL